VRLIISGGGTGGHVYPALAAVQSLNRQCANAGIQPEILWVGSIGGIEETLVKQAGLKIELITAASLRGKNPVAAPKSLWTLSQGYRQSRRLIRRFQPDVLFVTGGYVCVPVTLAAWRAGIPIIIYLPDIEPGLAIKFLARFANRVAITTEKTGQFFKPGLTVVTGYPVRPELLTNVEDGARKARARQRLGLRDDLPVLLVLGGSRGARSINRALTGQIEAYLEVSQVVHVSGQLDQDWVQARWAKLSPDLQARYHVSAYLYEDMPAALQAADLVISRAGASILGEYPVVGLPAILVPYPYAGTHQALNANYLARHQAAVIIGDADLKQDLRKMTIALITNKERLRAMSQAGKALAKPDAAVCLAQEILEVMAHGN
jgi:UDP-N-acetylglucosamine--N-acetylmuramyl-(pentapeptide) pyrophosphoryl-undecaprenol N-acetylglucosamine transferase